MNNFIITTDEDTANKLELMGFNKIPNNSIFIVFANTNGAIINFDIIDKTKICYSNTLCI